MPKRLVICCDGTWNTPSQSRGGQPALTNVAKVAFSLSPSSESSVEQRVHYQPGVGTDRWDHIRGGAFGYGLSRNVRNAYRFIVENYEPGDELFFFGFSRGAFTARSTVGLIRNAGVLRRENADRIDEAYALYRDNAIRPKDTASQDFRQKYSTEPRIRFIGVWDTVGALGIPLSGVPGLKKISKRWAFHDTALSSIVDAAYQALAIDEQRGLFEPAIWAPQTGSKDQVIEQVWFSGVHSDVGGGYAKSGLSDIALTWMVHRAASCGLEFKPGAVVPAPGSIGLPSGISAIVDPQPKGDIHDSRTNVYRLTRTVVRGIGQKDPAHEYAGSTAIARRDAAECNYRSSGLKDYLATPDHQIIDVLPAGAIQR
jgi:uncharacterized protein (DUF2235 family)